MSKYFAILICFNSRSIEFGLGFLGSITVQAIGMSRSFFGLNRIGENVAVKALLGLVCLLQLDALHHFLNAFLILYYLFSGHRCYLKAVGFKAIQ